VRDGYFSVSLLSQFFPPFEVATRAFSEREGKVLGLLKIWTHKQNRLYFLVSSLIAIVSEGPLSGSDK
jgi:hypothetical protein